MGVCSLPCCKEHYLMQYFLRATTNNQQFLLSSRPGKIKPTNHTNVFSLLHTIPLNTPPLEIGHIYESQNKTTPYVLSRFDSPRRELCQSKPTSGSRSSGSRTSRTSKLQAQPPSAPPPNPSPWITIHGAPMNQLYSTPHPFERPNHTMPESCDGSCIMFPVLTLREAFQRRM